MKIETIEISKLIPADYNPRKLSDEQYKTIKDSLTKFGFVDPVIVNSNPKRKNIIVGGHQRVKVWGDMGNLSVPVYFVNLSSEDEKELNIRLNKNTGSFDFDILMDESIFKMNDLLDWGFKESEFPVLINEDDESEEDDFDVNPENETKIVLGDLIEIGPHKLLCGSSTEMDTWNKLMGDKKGDLVVTDPPYNVDYIGKTKDALKIQNDKKTDSDFYQFLYDFYTAIGSYTKEGGSYYVWHADSEGHNFRKAMMDAGILVKQCLIWAKNSMVMGRQDYHWQHEPCLYGWKAGAAHRWYSDRKQTTLLKFDRPQRNAEHPTMKPVKLIAYQINNSSKPEDIILDGFLGSGTTMVASHQLNRICYGMELDPKYCQVIIDRMKKLDPNLEVKLNGKIFS